jgi:hypothetical protein
MKLAKILAASLAVALATPACVSDESGPSEDESNLTSRAAQFLEFSFEGEAVVPEGLDGTDLHKAVQAQMFYLAGELDKTHGAHGRFGYVELDDVQREAADAGSELVRYSAKVQVAWPKRDSSPPESYRVVVPRSVDQASLNAFNSKYYEQCGHNKYGAENLWYDWRPVSTGCALGDDVVDVTASVAPSPQTAQQDRYPEYQRFWEDGEFRVVLVHGTDGASSVSAEGDGLVRQYLDLQDELREKYYGASVSQGDTSYNVYDDWTMEASVPAYGGGDGKLVVTTMLTSSVKYIADDSAFDQRFDELTANADLIIYGGHSGLSKNIKAIAGKGVVAEGQYQVVFLQGCSTYAYLDRSINDRRTEVNGAEADPDGTRFLDVIVTGQPAYFFTNVPSFLSVIGDLSDDQPHSYMDIIDGMPQSAVPVVAGELDNPTSAP